MCHCCVSSSPGSLCHRNPPHPAVPKVPPASPARGEAIGFIPLKCYYFFTMSAGEGRLCFSGPADASESIGSP